MPYYLTQEDVREILVVDDGSTDGTASYVRQIRKEHATVRYVVHNIRKGLPAARNTGLNQVSQESEYIFFGEDDVIIPAGFISSLLEILRKTDFDGVGSRILSIERGETFDECIRRYARYLEWIKKVNKRISVVNQTLMLGNFFLDIVAPTLFLPACSLFRRCIFEKIRFDEGYRYNYFREETDAHVQASMRGFRLLYAGNRVCYHLRSSAGGAREYGRALPSALGHLLKLVGFPRDFYSTVNNNRFLDKFYPYLRERCRYDHCKEYYEALFALYWLRLRLQVPLGFLERKISGLDTGWRTLVT
jgi:glycosyltransferase involved in cell wall biosynthesis